MGALGFLWAWSKFQATRQLPDDLGKPPNCGPHLDQSRIYPPSCLFLVNTVLTMFPVLSEAIIRQYLQTLFLHTDFTYYGHC